MIEVLEWRSASEWVEQGLPGLPTSKFGFIKAADREGWERRTRKGRGGGFEYHYSSLPEAAQRVYLAKHLTPLRFSEMMEIEAIDAAIAHLEKAIAQLTVRRGRLLRGASERRRT